MCNRISIPSSNQLKIQFPDLEVEDFDGNYHSNGYDHEQIPILTNLEPHKIQGARWGFLPETASSLNALDGYDTLNAKCETLFDSRLYGASAATKRCIIFVNGFFEFKSFRKEKYPHFIAKEDGSIFAFGGVWSQWRDIKTCSIITTPANRLLSEIHNLKHRMPLVLPRHCWDQWLDIGQSRDTIQDMMQPYAVNDLVAWQVSGLLTEKEADKNTLDVQQSVGPLLQHPPYPDPVPKPEKPAKKPKLPKDPPGQLGLF